VTDHGCRATEHGDERPGDHAAHAEAPADQIECHVADAVELVDGDDVLVRGDLKHAVR